MTVSGTNGVVLASRTLVALLLIASGVAKLFDLESFAGAVKAFALLPAWMVSSVARTIPIGECLTGAFLLQAVVVPYSAARWAGLIAIGLFAVFSGAVSINLMRGRRDISCGCFGAKQDRISWVLVGRNCVLGGISYLAFQSISSSNQAVISGERLGALLFGLSMLLMWQLATIIIRLSARNQAEG